MTERNAIGIVGLGLMGGSIAHALARLGRAVVAVEPDASVREAARGLVAEVHASPSAALARCDLVVLAAPVHAIEGLLAPVSSHMADGAILTDVAGVKVRVVEAARTHVRAGVRFVGSHPMFGGVSGGFSAASAERVGGVGAVCEDHASEETITAVCAFWESLSVRTVRCTADAHDAAMARVSHLPYVLACLLARNDDPLATSLAGRGFADATRLAAFAFEIQGEVARRNPHLPAAIDELIERLEQTKRALSDPEALRRLFRRV